MGVFDVPFHRWSRSSWTDRLLLGVTGALLACTAALAALPSLWEGLVGATVVAMGGLIWLRRRDVLSMGTVLWGAVGLRLLFLPLLPELTDDPFRYLWDGWLQIEGVNPYRFVPKADALAPFQESVLFREMNSQPYYSIYPPLSQLTFVLGGMGQLVDWRLGYYLLKLLYTVVELGGVALLARMTTARNVLLYAWHPVVLLETAGQGHTEALLVPLLLGLVWAVRHGRAATASMAVAGAGLVKLYPFVLGPFLVRRFGWRAVWPGALVAGLCSLPYAAPYVVPHMKASVDLFSELFEFNAGPYYLVKYVFWVGTGADWSKVIGPVFRGMFIATLPVLYAVDAWRDWPLRRAILWTIGLLFVLSTTVHPWYLVPLLALGVLDESPPWHWFWLATASVGTYLFYVGGTYWLWILLGWGGAGGIALWRHRTTVRGLVQTVRGST
jgi:hypothetical protein